MTGKYGCIDLLLEGREGTTDAMVSMQRELLDAYEQASRAWLAR